MRLSPDRILDKRVDKTPSNSIFPARAFGVATPNTSAENARVVQTQLGPPVESHSPAPPDSAHHKVGVEGFHLLPGLKGVSL